MNSLADGAIELEPWLIVLGTAPETTLAIWRIEASGDDSIALFSDRDRAETYARSHCAAEHELILLDTPSLVRVMADCFRQGIRYATLNPTDNSARQVFVLRDVLSAARAKLEQARRSS